MASFTVAQRKVLAKAGVAMPDGSYPVRNADDLQSAIILAGKAGAEAPAVRKHIMARAKTLGLSDKIPDTWNADGSLNHEAMGEAFLEHFGVKGMHWGVRKDRGSSHPVSEDSARASELRATVKKHGTSALSNQDLQHLVTRLNLEQQHSRLDPKQVSAGEKILHDVLKVGGNVAQQQATTYANKYAAKGIEHLITKAAA